MRAREQVLVKHRRKDGARLAGDRDACPLGKGGEEAHERVVPQHLLIASREGGKAELMAERVTHTAHGTASSRDGLAGKSSKRR